MKNSPPWGELTLLVSLALFFSLTLYQIELPGLYYDEAADAVPAMQLLLGQPLEPVRGAALWLGDRALPLMVMDYVGAVNSYLLLPFFRFLGISVFSLRLMTIVLGATTILLTYLCAKDLFNPGVASVTALLLAVQPSFVFWSRQGIYVTSVMTTLAMASLWCLLRWWRRRNPLYLYGATFLLGLGISAKILFLWFLVALGVSAVGVILYQRRSASSLPQPARAEVQTHPHEGLSPFQAVIAALSFGIGASMIFIYNLQTQGTLLVLQENLLSTGYGVSNLAFIQNLVARLDAFNALLNGGHFWFFGNLFYNPIYVPIFMAASLVCIALLMAVPSLRPYGRKVAFLQAMLALLFVQSAFTISGLWPTHLLILLPLPQMVIATCICMAYEGLPFRRAVLTLGTVAVIAILVLDLKADVNYHQVLGKTGGWLGHSDGIYSLAEYLNRRDATQPLAMDWGIKPSVQILTQGRVNPVESFQYQKEPDADFFHRLYKAMDDPQRLYVFRTEEWVVYPRFAQFEGFARQMGKKPVLEKTITQRDGKSLYTIYSVR